MKSRLSVHRTVKLHIEFWTPECSHWVHDLEATVTSLLPDTIEIKTAIDTTISSHVHVIHTLGGVAAMTQRAHLKPVLNWANVCSPEHTSDTSTNYDSFLN